MLSGQLFRRVSITTIIILVVLAVVYTAFHGSLLLEANSSVNYISSKESGFPSIGHVASSGAIASGNYTGEITNDGNSSIYSFDIGHFLAPTNLTTQPSNYSLTVLGRLTDQDLAIKNGNPISYSSSTIHTLSTVNIDGSRSGDTKNIVPNFTSSILVQPSKLAGFTQTSGSIQPEVYDFSSNKTTSYPAISTPNASTVTLQPAGEWFSIFDKASKTLYIYTDDPSSVKVVKLDNTSSLAYFNGNTPVLSCSTSKLAVATGRSSTDSTDTNSSQTSSNSSVQLLDTTSNKTLFQLNFNTIITNVSLSHDSKYLFIQTPQQAAIYNTSTQKQVKSFPLQITQFVWGGENDFAFTSSDGGLFAGNISNPITNTVASRNAITPTSISFVDNKKVYFTGFQSYSTGNTSPDAYVYDMGKNTSSTDTLLLSKLPHQGSNFYVDVIGNTIIVQTTRYITKTGVIVDTAAQHAGDTFAKQLIGSDGKYHIINTYIDSDLRN